MLKANLVKREEAWEMFHEKTDYYDNDYSLDLSYNIDTIAVIL